MKETCAVMGYEMTPRDPTIPPDAFERTDLAVGRTRVWQGTDGTLYVRTPEGEA
jgi:hypothetical protein